MPRFGAESGVKNCPGIQGIIVRDFFRSFSTHSYDIEPHPYWDGTVLAMRLLVALSEGFVGPLGGREGA